MIRKQTAFTLVVVFFALGTCLGLWLGYGEGFVDGRQWWTDNRPKNTFRPDIKACGWADYERRKPIRWCLRKES